MLSTSRSSIDAGLVMTCVALASMSPKSAEARRGGSYEREGAREVNGVRGEWLDDDGNVLPEFRTAAAEARRKNPRGMVPIGEAMVIAQTRRG